MKQKNMLDIKINIVNKNEFKTYQNEIKKIFEENFFKNGGMLYSDDFMINSDFMVVAKMQNKVVAYMAISKLTENELNRKYEIYQEEPIMQHSIVIKHLVVSQEYRRQKIATRLFQYIKEYANKNEIDYLYLWTTPENLIAINFYEKQGFYKMGDYKPTDGEFQGLNGFHSIMMVYKRKESEEQL